MEKFSKDFKPTTDPKGFDVTYISLGCGVQSSALAAMSVTGYKGVPKADFAIFADTQWETQATYDYFKVLEKWLGDRGLPVYKATKGSVRVAAIEGIAKPLKNRFISVPAFTKGEFDDKEGRLRRQCTREFKIEVIERKLRELMGYEKRKRVKHKVRALIGISIDEFIRMKDSRTPWVKNGYPLVDLHIRREKCSTILTDMGLPKPTKSACVGCPYHDNRFWLNQKNDSPEEFADAVDFDKAIRNGTKAGITRPVFLHRSCRPLDEIDFEKELDTEPGQLTMFDEECEGMCGV